MHGIFFDWDNTLINSYAWSSEYMTKYFGEVLGGEVSPNLLRKYFNNGWEEATRRIAKELGKEIPEEEIIKYATEGRKRKNVSKCEIFPGVLETLKKVKEKGVPVALCSNNLKKDLLDMLALHDMTHFFDEIIGEDEVKKGKPEPDIYLLAAEKFGLKPENCLVVEDSITGVRAGKAAGMKVLALGTGTYKKEDLMRFEADFFSPTLAEIDVFEILTK